MQVTREWRTATGRFTRSRSRPTTAAVRRGAPPRLDLRGREVWEQPAKYGLTRDTCPGHGKSRVCQYGAHDEIRFADTAWLAANSYTVIAASG